MCICKSNQEVNGLSPQVEFSHLEKAVRKKRKRKSVTFSNRRGRLGHCRSVANKLLRDILVGGWHWSGHISQCAMRERSGKLSGCKTFPSSKTNVQQERALTLNSGTSTIPI